MRSRLAVTALDNAARRSDLRRALARHDMIGSMGRVGAAGDNAAMESFFGLLQNNVLNRRTGPPETNSGSRSSPQRATRDTFGKTNLDRAVTSGSERIAGLMCVRGVVTVKSRPPCCDVGTHDWARGGTLHVSGVQVGFQKLDACIYTLLVEPVESSCVCTSLRMVTRSVNRLYDQALSEVGMRVTGYSILSRLTEEGPLSISQLAGRLAMERTTCTREVAPLLDAGLVEMTTGSDRRVRILQLTESGARKRAEAYPLWERVQRRLADDFGHTDITALLERLRRLQASSSRLSQP